jgi:hypothetical protein
MSTSTYLGFFLAVVWERVGIQNPSIGVLGFQDFQDGVACLLVGII